MIIMIWIHKSWSTTRIFGARNKVTEFKYIEGGVGGRGSKGVAWDMPAVRLFCQTVSALAPLMGRKPRALAPLKGGRQCSNAGGSGRTKTEHTRTLRYTHKAEDQLTFCQKYRLAGLFPFSWLSGRIIACHITRSKVINHSSLCRSLVVHSVTLHASRGMPVCVSILWWHHLQSVPLPHLSDQPTPLFIYLKPPPAWLSPCWHRFPTCNPHSKSPLPFNPP